jgi:hypothetical protein
LLEGSASVSEPTHNFDLSDKHSVPYIMESHKEIASDENQNDLWKDPQEERNIQEGVKPIQINSKKKIDKYLNNVKVPRNKMEMSDEYLEDFIYKFREKLSESSLSLRWASKIKINSMTKYPVRIVCNKARNKYGIRVLDTCHNHTVDQDSLSIRNQKQIVILFVRLIEWLLLINKSVLFSLGRIQSNFQEEYEAHHKLVDWFFDQAFNPAENRPPVIGNIENVEEGMDFGPIQARLSIYLSQAVRSNKSLEVAILITKSYYEKFQKDVSWWLKRTDEENDLESSLKRLIYRGIKSKLTIQKPIKSHEETLYIQAGNFRIPPLSFFPKTLKPGDPRILYDVKLDQEEEEIVEDLKSVLTQGNTKQMLKKIRLEKLPVLARNLSYNPKENYSQGFLLVIHNKRNLIENKSILNMINRMIVHLKACFVGLEETFKARNKEWNGELHKRSFFKWFHELLLEQKPNHFPLFGNFILKDQNFEDLPLSLEFSEMQELVIEYISSGNPNPKMIRLALALIGYWYKNHQHSGFILSFENDMDYWNTAIGILKNKFSYEGCFSLKKFQFGEKKLKF